MKMNNIEFYLDLEKTNVETDISFLRRREAKNSHKIYIIVFINAESSNVTFVTSRRFPNYIIRIISQ